MTFEGLKYTQNLSYRLHCILSLCLFCYHVVVFLNAKTCFPIFFFCIRDSSKKWQEKADLLTQLESQVKRMKENFDAKERLLLEERQKATEAHKYDADSPGMNSLQND